MTARPVPVAGVSRASARYPDALLALAREVHVEVVEPVAEVGFWDVPVLDPTAGRVLVKLVREPHNPVDGNAVRVEIPVLEDAFEHDSHVGWIPAGMAPVFADHMDEGWRPVAWVRSIPVGSPSDMHPGLVIFVDCPWPPI